MHTQEQIIDAVDKTLLEKELTKERFLRKANNGNNEIYVVTAQDSPNVMQEIGRLREITFREAGGGSGLACDIDHYDTMSKPYKQLIVWNPEEKQIVGGYRYIFCNDVSFYPNGQPELATSELFTFSDKFIKEQLPYTIELGRSFVQPDYQPSVNSRKGIYSLDNLWDGLGAIIVENPNMKYFYGKFTMYLDFNQYARDLILYFLNMYFPDNEKLIYPIEAISYHHPVSELSKDFVGNDFNADKKTLNQKVRSLNENIPPLVNAYMNLSSTMKIFGTALNHHFGDVEETGMIITIDDIYDNKKERHLLSHTKIKIS